MKHLTALAAILACCVGAVTPANILALLPTASPSHHIWNSALTAALARRGHNVTVVGPEVTKGGGPTLTDLLVPELYAKVGGEYSFEEMTETPTTQWISLAFEFLELSCQVMQKSDAFKRLMDYPSDTKFDLVIIESFGTECLFGVFPKFGNPPFIAINAFGIQHWVREMTGSPNFPSYMPLSLLPYTDRMSFKERLWNVYTNIYSYIAYHYSFLPHMNRMAREHFGSDAPPAEEVLPKVSLALSNFNHAFDFSWPTTPNLIAVGGMQIRDPEPLPKDLQVWLDGAGPAGAIFMSLGSNVRSDKLSPAKKRALLDAFARLPQRVLWKFESPIADLPPNVRVAPWLPQRDILAHPNLRVFVSHAGGLSTHESIWRGVPMLAVPFLADQHINARKLQRAGAAVLVEYRDLGTQTLLNALNTLINDTSYAEGMGRLSAQFRDTPLKPLEAAVFWAEFALRHRGAAHLRPAALDMGAAQYWLLDVAAAAVAAPLLALLLLKLLCHRKRYRAPAHKHKQG